MFRRRSTQEDRPAADEPDGRVCVVTTVKDTPENVVAWAERNLAAGADHLFVFVDDADTAVHAAVDGHPHVTAVRTGETYWQDARPRSLNVRQHVNANRVNVALTAAPQVRWLFHLDGDECLHLDRARLLALEPDVPAVRLGTWEAVSTREPRPGPALYKRPLREEELTLLTLLGVRDAASSRPYFRGHLRKVGLRPSLERKIALHRVEGVDGSRLTPFRAPWLHVLHDESATEQEFVRKWLAHASEPGSERRGSFKARLQAAVAGVARDPALDEDTRRELLARLFARHVEDDVETLDRLGLLERPDPGWHRHRPRPLGSRELGAVEQLLERLQRADATFFMCAPHGRPPAGLVPDLLPEPAPALGPGRRARRR